MGAGGHLSNSDNFVEMCAFYFLHNDSFSLAIFPKMSLFLGINCLIVSFLPMFALAFCAAPLSKNVSRLTYTKAEELCARETANRVKYCNLHNPTNLCICYTPAELVRDGTLLCPQLLRLDSLEYLVLTLSVAFPVPRGFLSDPDSIIAEDLELFTGFSQSNVLILRKGCSADRRSYVFQYAILRHAVNAAPFNDTDLRLIHPPMFKRFFLHQEGLTIARVVQSKFLLPLIGSTPAGQIYRKGQKLNGLGFCPLRDATQCYVGEMVLLFLVGLYASAECCCAICWHIFTIRQTATDITQGQACGGDAV